MTSSCEINNFAKIVRLILTFLCLCIFVCVCVVVVMLKRREFRSCSDVVCLSPMSVSEVTYTLKK